MKGEELQGLAGNKEETTAASVVELVLEKLAVSFRSRYEQTVSCESKLSIQILKQMDERQKRHQIRTMRKIGMWRIRKVGEYALHVPSRMRL